MASISDALKAAIQQQKDLSPQQYLQRNVPWSQQNWQTQMAKLSPEKETQFLQWVKQNQVPVNLTSQTPDYDMRGFWLALQNKDPRAMTAVNPTDKKLHYPDYWKTPYHKSFSNESQWAKSNAPKWQQSGETSYLATPQGQVIFVERPEK